MKQTHIKSVIATQKHHYYPLLLLADPSKEMIAQYLEQSTLWLLQKEQQEIGIAAVLQTGDCVCELKNFAIAEPFQGKGYGTLFLQMLLNHYKEQYDEMQVGTSNSGVPFYEKLGFCYSHTLPGFFIKNYPTPLYEGSVQCIDMIYLYRNLSSHPLL